MKITAFLGSPRPGGNTDILASRVLDGAEKVGVETEVVALRRLKIKPCVACGKCWRKGRPCAFDDDMTRLYETIAASDFLLLATPVYWYAPTAIMKAFIDRLVVFNHPEGRPIIKGKEAILVVAYEEEGPEAADPLLRMFEMSFDYLGVSLIERLVVDGVGPKGAVLQKPAVLERAYDIGRSLKKRVKA
ncbi:MAG: flavodoxin family protein [Armatimonadota bacterium]|nr:flavodoxin family protein [Armatimonadota bacterium]